MYLFTIKTKEQLYMESNLSRIQTVVAEQLGLELDQVKPDAHFEFELGADSLEVVELIMAVEYEFDMEIEDIAASEMTNVQDILDYIEGRWVYSD